MNRALWEKTFREGKWLLAGSGLLLFVHHLIRVWITSMIEMGQVRLLLQHVPEFIQGFFVVPLDALASPAGRLALGYDDPFVFTVIAIWGIARGSDSVSGEIGRGTMEMLLAQPVRRFDVLFSQSAVTILGAAALAGCSWLGTLVGLSIFKLESPVPASLLLPAALNLFSVGIFMAGLTTCLSSLDRYRSRTIGIVVGFFAIEMILKMIGMSAKHLGWLKCFSFITLYDPQRMTYRFWPEVLARAPEEGWNMLLQFNGTLVLLGLLAYVAALLIFCRRDLPAPL